MAATTDTTETDTLDVVDDATDRVDDTTAAHADDTDESAELPTIQQAFEKAKEKHSRQAREHARSPEASTETAETTTDETPARGPKKAVGTPDTTAETPTTESAQTGLLTEAEFKALQTKHANDPAKLYAELNRAFTQKSQARATDLKTFERVKPYVELIDAFEEDAEATLAALAGQYGKKLVSADGTAETETTSTATTEETAEPDIEAIVSEFREDLGPELEYIAEAGPAITRLIQRLTKSITESTVKPLKQQQDALLADKAVGDMKVTMKTFEERHPDWKEHEDAMVSIGQTLAPNGLNEAEYMERLYQLATRDAWEKDRDANVEKTVVARVKAAIAKINKGAEETETVTDATPERHVRSAPPTTPTIHEAYEAAKRGERWD
jgi:hypothetical protein